MSREILAVPEEDLEQVIKVIRYGLKTVKVRPVVKSGLLNWCKDMENYVKDTSQDD